MWGYQIYHWSDSVLIGLAELVHGRARYIGCLSVCLSVIIGSHFQVNSNVNIACSTAISLFPMIGKVIFYCNFVSREPSKVQKANKSQKTVSLGYESHIVLQKIDEGLEDLSAKSTYNMCRFHFSYCLLSYCIFLNRSPGVYFFPAPASPAFIQESRFLC